MSNFSKLWIVNTICINKGSYNLLQELKERNDVIEIIYDEKYEISPMELKSEPALNKQQPKIEWNLEWTKVPAVWKKGFTGKGKIVGLVDTGVNYKHESLIHNYKGTQTNGSFNHDFNWFDPAGRLQEPQDTQDHGSHCTGTVLGSTANRTYITGASYGSKWIHCHFGGSYQAISKCFQFLLAPHDRQGRNGNPSLRPHVTSHSYGGGASGRSQLEDVVNPVVDAGVHVVVAAHNYAGCRTVTDPGVCPKVLTVGALGEKNKCYCKFLFKRT